MKNLKTWDKKTWISSEKYINEINDFIIKNSKLNRHSRILDIGCGRGKITGQLKDVLKLDYKPIGIDKIKHKDIDKRIVFKKNLSEFFRKNLLSYDLILIKQTIHLFRKSFIKKLLSNLIRIINKKGVILIINIDSDNYKMPLFKKLEISFKKSLLNNKKKLQYIKKLYPKIKTRKFTFDVLIDKKQYSKWLNNRFMSCLLKINKTDIDKNIIEINKKFKKDIHFKDNLICFILKN